MSVEDLKKELMTKERSNRILHAENEKLKRTLSERTSYDNLVKKIEVLQKEIDIKNTEIKDLKALAQNSGSASNSNPDSSSSSGAGLSKPNETQELKTKIIVLQSKLRKSNQDIDNLKSKIETLELQNKTLQKKAENSENLENSNKDLGKYREAIIRYQNQISEMDKKLQQAQIYEQQILSLKQQLANQRRNASSDEMREFTNGDSDEIQNLKMMLEDKNKQIADLQNHLSSGGTSGNTGFLAQNRINRRVAELEAQITMLKKNEADMKHRYEDAVKKLAAREEFSDW